MDIDAVEKKGKKSIKVSSLALRQTSGYYATFIGHGMLIASLGPTLPYLASNTQTSLDQISLLFITRSLGFLLGSLGFGRIFDRAPGHIILGGVLVVAALVNALVPVQTTLWLLTLLMLGLGMGEGALDIGANLLLVWVHKHRVGPYLNALHFCFGIGALLAPVIFAQTIQRTSDVKWGYWIITLYAIPIALWLLRMPSPVASANQEDRDTRQASIVLVILIALFFFLYVGAEASFGDWIFTYTINLGLSNPVTASYLNSAFWGALTMGRLISIPLATRFQPGRLLALGLLGSLASLATILFWNDSIAAIWAGTIGLGLSMAPLFPSMLVYAEKYMAITGDITRWFFVGVGIGGMLLPWLIGQGFESIGPQVTIIWILIDMLLALLVFSSLSLYTRRTH